MAATNTIQIIINAKDQASKALTGINASMAKMGEIGREMSLKVTLPLIALGTVAVKSASDLSESVNKVAVVFDEAADSVQEWSKESARAFGLSRRNALEAAGTFGNLFTSMGMAKDASADMSTKLVELAGDLASFNNIDPTVALEKLRSGLVGEVEPLRTLGVNINQAAVQAEALRMGLITAGQELSTQAAVQARFSLILKQTANAQGDFARTSDGLANSTRIAKAELENAAAMLGEKLIPIAADAVGFLSDLVDKFTSLPGPVMDTALALGGIAVIAGPVMSAINGINLALKMLMANPLVALVTILIGGAIALTTANLANAAATRDLEEANKAAAAEILVASDSYKVYIEKLEDAGLLSYALSDGLYEVAKSADAGTQLAYAQALQEAASSTEDMLKATLDLASVGYDTAEEANKALIESIQEGIGSFSKAELAAMQDVAALKKLFIEEGRTEAEAATLAQAIADLAAAEKTGAFEAQWLANILEFVAANTEAAATVTEAAADSNSYAAYGYRVLKEAVEAYNRVLEATTGITAQGIITLRDMGAQAAESTRRYESSLQDLESEASAAYDSIADKYKNSLPDATTVAERLGMAGDAWDEWGLRLQDIINQGVASPWYAALQEMGYAKPPDVGVKEWAQQLKQDFYEGELPALIQTGSYAWQTHADEVAAAQAEETAAVNAQIAARRAALQAERDAEAAAQAQARQDALVGMALQLAEESGQIEIWAAQRFGAQAGIADTAAEVQALLESGMLSLDSTLSGIIGSYTGNLTTMLDTTAAQAAETNTELAGIVAGTATAAAEGTTTALGEVEGVISDTESLMGTAMDEAETATDTSMKAITTAVKTEGGKTITAAEKVAADVVGAFGNVETEMGKVGKAMLEGIKTGIEDNWVAFTDWLSNKIVALVAALLMGMGGTTATGGTGGGGTGGGSGGGTSPNAPVPGGLGVQGDTYYVTVTDRLAAAMLLSNVRGRQQRRLAVGMGG